MKEGEVITYRDRFQNEFHDELNLDIGLLFLYRYRFVHSISFAITSKMKENSKASWIIYISGVALLLTHSHSPSKCQSHEAPT